MLASISQSFGESLPNRQKLSVEIFLNFTDWVSIDRLLYTSELKGLLSLKKCLDVLTSHIVDSVNLLLEGLYLFSLVFDLSFSLQQDREFIKICVLVYHFFARYLCK